jgi:S1/P1 Nuclease
VKRHCLALIVLLAAASTCHAWNNKGHMTVARLAWNELTEAERAKILDILKAHPHLDEFLRADRPDNFSEDEWVFLRAATWADWVKNHHQKFSVPARHFIDTPYVAKGSQVTPPALGDENVVSGIKSQKKAAVSGGNQADRAVAVTWLLHLVGDIHQPMHTISLYSDDFPTGDRGGNLAMVRINGRGIVRLHPMWDGLFGTSTTRSSILGTVAEVRSVAEDNASAIAGDLKAHPNPDDWAKESYLLAIKVAYLDGKLQPANVNNEPDHSDIPAVDDDYARNAGKTAQLCADKGGKRLAQVLRDVIKNN